MTQFFRLIGLLRINKLYTALGILFQLLTAVFTLVSIPFVIPFFQILFGTSPSSVRPAENFWDIESTLNYGFSRLIAMSDRPTALMVVCIAVIIIFTLRNLFRFLSSFFIIPAINGVTRDLRADIFKAYTDMPLLMRMEEKKGHLMSLISTDLGEVDHGILKALELLFKSPLIVLGAVIFMIWLSPQLSVIALVLIAFTLIIIGTLSHSLKRPSVKAQEGLADINTAADEYLHSKKLIDAYNAKSYFISQFSRANTNLYHLSNFILRKRDLASPLTELLGVIAVVILLWYGAQLVFAEQMTPTTFFTFIFAFYHIIDPAKRFSREFANVHKGLAALDRIDAFISAPPPLSAVHSDGKDIHKFENSLEFRDVMFSFGQDNEPILKNVSFAIRKGEKVGIMGLSGAGKTSMIDLMLRFYPGYKGNILLDDIPVEQYNMIQYRQLFGLVSQEPFLFHASIKDNILLERKYDEEKFNLAAEHAHLTPLALQKPMLFDTVVGDAGVKLSGGERQRITIARALYDQPAILVLDEPTSSLDLESESIVYTALMEAMQNRTTILISHNLDLLRKMDRILVLDSGRIIQEGSGEELKQKKGLFARLIKLKNDQENLLN